MEKDERGAQGGQRPEAGGGSVTPLRPSASPSLPAWDITTEEIEEWGQTPGLMFIAHTAKRIRDGKYHNGQEVYPDGSVIYTETCRDLIAENMELLVKRGMLRKSGDRWFAIAPGRLAPPASRAVRVLLAMRDDLPTALAAELDAYQATLTALTAQPPGRKPAAPAFAARTAPARASAAVQGGSR
ncbi:MAG TPA: hypothetical protein VH478_15580 [Trebonia sp.]|jgi:hypothetical protein|nr:hypothetical protein [Trebonia sp.]